MVRVLVVEDEANIREMIALNLRLAGMEAAFFSSSPCSLMNQSSICMARKSLASYAAA